MQKTQTLIRNFVAVAALTAAGIAQAAVGLYNTGVDAGGNPLPLGTVDSHYTVDGGDAYAFDASGGYPVGPWLGDNTTSAWISPTTTTFAVSGATYTYATSFDLTGIDLGTAFIAGRWASDDPVTGVRLNGNTLGLAGGNYTYWTPFTIASGFTSGINTLAFDVINSGGGPTGLRVEFTDLRFTPAVPEPQTYAMLIAGLTVAGIFVRRRKA